MAVPAFGDLTNLASTANGLHPEAKEERILTILAMLASGAGPDGTPIPGSPTLPPALGAGAPFTTYTDPSGEVYVAKGGVYGGAYKKARDVLHVAWYRGAAFTSTATPTLLGFDSMDNDPYGLYSTGTSYVTVPLAGVWRTLVRLSVSATATGQWVQVTVYRSGVGDHALGMAHSSVATTLLAETSLVRPFNAGDQVGAHLASSVTLNGYTGAGGSHFEMDYLGTG